MILLTEYNHSIVLSGDCCKTCCPSNCVNNTACVTCQPAPCHPGYHVDIKYFQLTQIDIPAQVSDLYVQKLVLQVRLPIMTTVKPVLCDLSREHRNKVT